VHANADAVLDALGDATRRQIFGRLKQGGRSVGQLAQGLQVTRSAVSQHLLVLRTAQLVTSHADGTRRIYEVDPRGVAAARAWLDGFWDDTLDAFKAAAEREARNTEEKS
jgi:DNA-binding transcriptional ArsR family regulator